jgi:hypothetical protein
VVTDGRRTLLFGDIWIELQFPVYTHLYRRAHTLINVFLYNYKEEKESKG